MTKTVTKITLDPGHGGYDPGALGPSGLKEKDINLKIVKLLGAILQKHDIEVLFTRSNDDHVSIDNRIKYTNNSKVDYFISVHCNSAAHNTAKGTETYAYKAGTKGDALAKSIQSSLVNEIKLADRGVKYAQLRVTKETLMPAALVEVAFINNPAEEKLLSNDLFLETAAIGIAKGILKFLNIEYIPPGSIKLENVSTWAIDAMNWGIINGLTDGTNPQSPLTLERFITILHRYKNL